MKASTRQSIGSSRTTVDPLTCLSATSRSRPQNASAAPRTAARPDRIRLSASSWRTMRDRLAPRARRTAISGRRAAPRARSRVATLAQAARSTRPTRPIRMRSDSRWRARLSFSPCPPGSTASVGGSGIGRASAAGTTDSPARQPSRAVSCRIGWSAALICTARGRRRESSHHAHPPVEGLGAVLGAVGLEARVQGQRHGDVGGLADLHRAREPARRHADDDGGDAVHLHRLADDGRVAAESPLPVAPGDDGHRRRGEPVVVFGQRPAEDRGDAEARVIAAGGELAQDLGLGKAVHEQVDLIEGREGEDVGEPGVMRAEVLEREQRETRARRPSRRGIDGAVVLTRPRHPAARALHVAEQDQAVGIADGERAQQHVVHQAEHGRVGADAQGQREDGDGGESGGVGELAQPMPQVAAHAGEKCHRALLSTA